MENQNSNVYVSNIQRFSVHDGPGIRTVVFLLGCPLRCKWCQNPEAINKKPQIMFDKEACTKCGECVKACPNGAITLDEDIKIHRDRCNDCLECADNCMFEALSVSGKEYSVNKLFDEVMKDKVFYKNSNGGVTLSGGEPTMHPEFCYSFFSKLKNNNISTAIETCGYAKKNDILKIAEKTDIFLYDIKLFDEEKHIKWTGVSNKIILENLLELTKIKKKIIVRIPLIPGVNDDIQEFTKIIKHVVSLNVINEVHILPFHQYGSSKYKLIDMEYELKHLKEFKEDQVEKYNKIALDHGLKVSIGGSGTKSGRTKKSNRSFIYEVS